MIRAVATRTLPSGTVTFLFSDVEGSTRLLHTLGADAYADALATHRAILRDAFERHGGAEVDTQGDGFFVAFPTAPGALAAALEATEALSTGPITVRIGLHTGSPLLTDEGYVGPDVHKGARIAAAGHGGQVLVSAATAALLDGADLRDLGEHRLKDLTAPERIFQADAGEHPPLKTLHQTNLPVPTTSFLGRERELGEVVRLLARDDVRLLTLTGPGGTGKTRLALEAAAEAADAFPGGVWWVPLAPLRDPSLVVPSTAGILGASGDLADHIGDRRMLLLFDNFEHLTRAAVDIGSLLVRCPNLRALVTSREVLQLPAEHVYPVPPLEADQGVELFVARARAARPDFIPDDSVPDLCARLDSLPLAIELAAARARLLSPRQLLERLGQKLDLLKGGRGADPRQETLRATIEWSYDLLAPEEQRSFARLAVFRNGATLDAAEGVADVGLDTLGSLVDKSLIRARDERFVMLETIREYAIERLEASGEADDLRRRHADYFLALAEEALPEISRGTPKAWLDRVDLEHDNLRAALDRLEAAGDTQSVLQLASAMGDYWQIRGPIIEGRRRLDAALAADSSPTRARARALHAAVTLEDDAAGAALAIAEARAAEALRISEGLGDRHGVAFALQAVGWVAAMARDWQRARDTWEESRRAFREVGDDHYYLGLTRSVAWMSSELGDHAGYRELVEEYVEGARATGNRRVLARGLSALSELTFEDGRFADAIALVREAYAIDREHGFVVHVANDLCRVAAYVLKLGKPEVAARLVAVSDRLHEEAGALRESWAARERDSIISGIQAQLPEPVSSAASRAGTSMTPDEALALALAELEPHVAT